MILYTHTVADPALTSHLLYDLSHESLFFTMQKDERR